MINSLQKMNKKPEKTSNLFPIYTDIRNRLITDKKMTKISVLQVGEICDVARSTVSYWIAKRSLPATRLGKKHEVSVNDLILFLKSSGRPIPQILLDMKNGDHCPPFYTFKNCWEYWANDSHGTKCRNCSVFTHKIKPCFVAGNNRRRLCPNDCHQCRYFAEFYESQTVLIHQIDKPAAVYQDLYFWAGNRAWIELFGLDVKKIPGAGIEDFLHPQSLKNFLNYFKRMAQGDTMVPDTYEVPFFCENPKENGVINVRLSFAPLKMPPGTWVMLAEKINDYKGLQE